MEGQESKNLKKGGGADLAFSAQFRYRHQNPYHHRLGEFGRWVLRDHEAEQWAGRWNAGVFQRQAPLVVEIGTGHGHFMREYLQRFGGHNYVGLDYCFKRSYHVVRKVLNARRDTCFNDGQGHFRYLRAKGERLSFIFGESEVDHLFYFFPDPWPKRRHHKKRLFQAPFLERAHHCLRPGGRLWIKTDHTGYAFWMEQVAAEQKLFRLGHQSFDLYRHCPGHFLTQHQTKFEKIFLRQGTAIKSFVLECLKAP